MTIISIVMPLCRETEKEIRRAVDSILCQTFKDFELIIVIDDPANSRAISLIKEYSLKDSRVRYYANERNCGVSFAINKAIRSAKGRYIARQDADDESLPDRLRKQYEKISADNSIDAIGSAVSYINETRGYVIKRRYNENVGDEIRRYCPVAHPTIVAKRELFDRIGYYNETKKFIFAEDYELWCRWYLKGVKFCNLSQSLYNYYQGNNCTKQRNTKKQLLSTIKVKWRYSRELGFNFFDYIYLAGEAVTLLFPAQLIVALFYFFQKNKI